MLIIISPSKTQEISTERFKKHTIPQYIDKSQEIIEKLQQFNVEELGKMMGMSRKLSELNQQRFADFNFPPTLDKCGQAIFTFKGDVYSAITAENYSSAEINFAQDHLRILSGLYGILRPLDLIQAHRLEMGSKFKPEAEVSLYQLWSKAITFSLNKSLSTMKSPVLLNLASNEYSKVMDKKRLAAPIVNVSFKQLQNGKLRTIAIYAKRARGAMVDFVIRKKLENLSDLFSFDHDGYGFDRQSSTEAELLFTR